MGVLRETARAPQPPTNRAPNEPLRPICAQESIFLGKNGRFWAKHPNYFGREQKFPLIRKPPRHLIRIVFLVMHCTKWIRKATMPKKNILGQIWQLLGQNPNFLESEHLVPIVFWSGIAPTWTRKAYIWPKRTKNANYRPILAKNPYF